MGRFPNLRCRWVSQARLNGTQSTSLSGQPDGFISAFDLNTLTLVWSTYFGGYGGSLFEKATDITTDDDGNIYVVGVTDMYGDNVSQCTWDGTESRFIECNSGGYFQDSFGGGQTDHYILKFSPATAMLWSTKIGGNRNEGGEPRVACDADKNVFIYGNSNSGFIYSPVYMQENPAYFHDYVNADPGTSNTGDGDAYVACFDLNKHCYGQLYWEVSGMNRLEVLHP